MIVEPQLREHFRIAHSTHTYDALLAAAPAEFVGGPGRLAAIVEVLSSAVAVAFKDQSLPLPPWRRAKSVLSKWGLGASAAGLMPEPNTSMHGSVESVRNCFVIVACLD